jgi:hypothetical protein
LERTVSIVIAVGNDAEIIDYNWSAPGFDTDFSRMIIDPAEILSGGPPKDGIPAIDNPQYQSIEEAESWLVDREPVILVRVSETSRIYPLQILTWHEIINDEINGTPLAVRYASVREAGVPDANLGGDPIILFWSAGTASALDSADISQGQDMGFLNGFLAEIDDVALDFESLGDGLFTDIQSGSIWDSGGRALEGDYAGTRLEPVTGIRHFWFSARAFSDGKLVQ